MAVKTLAKKLPSTYFDLVQQFPLTHIKDEEHLEAAQETLDRLLEMHLDEGAQEYLDALTDLVETYEDENEVFADASEADVLRELMRSNHLSQQKLAKEVRISQSTVSAVLNGTRSLTKEQLVTLARYFHVSPGVFLPVERGRADGSKKRTRRTIKA
jgi:HTH-type transcriptional regulator/antitoxin HigA